MGGLSLYDKNAPENTYYEGREIDPHDARGYLKPGWVLTEITKSSDGTPIILNNLVDMVVDTATNDAYFIDNTDKLYHMNSILTGAFNADFDGGGNYYYDIPSATQGKSLAIYSKGGTSYLFFAYNVAAAGDVGMHTLGTNTFDPVYLSTTVGTGAAALQKAPHPMMEWKTFMWIANGRYLGKFDGANDTWDATKLDLGPDWEITAIFPTQNYIGVCAWKPHALGQQYRTEARIFMWDGTSDTFNYWIPIIDNKIVAALNHQGIIYIWTQGMDSSAINFGYLAENRVKLIRKLEVPLAGTLSVLDDINVHAVTSFGNRVFFGVNHLVFSYGRDSEDQPMALTIPFGYDGDNNDSIGFLKSPFAGSLFMGLSDIGTAVKYLYKIIGSGFSTDAVYRGNYKDFGQDVQINYVKLYFKELAAGDSITPTIEVNYGATPYVLKATVGAANTSANFTADGDITSKRFAPPQGKLKCHAFRPVITSWAGAVSVSKIIIDYSFINDY